MLDSSRVKQIVPLLFVLLWSTGFIGARFGLPYIEPFNFLFIRMLLTLVVFAGLILVLRSRWPNRHQALHQMVVGSLVHAGYLGGVFAAIRWQMPAGVTSLIVGLQPLLTAVLAWVIWQQRLRLLQWLGLALGLLGVVLVLAGGNRLNQFELMPAALLAVLVALVAISVGTLYQKRFGQGVDLVAGSFFQYLATAVWMGLLSFAFETRVVDWQLPLIGAMAWLVLGLSVSAILLLMLMIREGESSRVASYFYLVPPVTAIEAWWLFDEQLGLIALCGVAITVAGVYLVLRPQRAR
ncbi:Permease of the drug/metabolite transporter (DMT) superfamily [Marinobacterium lacunae]|uniref:Permease of the drug/metabolite transporter (DMT) superfamily n=2 Tax=Marinobacterium lacunae TaxID=1232683 RepID=A0A081FYJ2_9GAMM|nr:Permease of the drug/metabolite transporter (DMT) superfamily [Marinobacterium lacunae]MBR9884497.1 DMT family transporter [Oceanospirillales bacterium]